MCLNWMFQPALPQLPITFSVCLKGEGLMKEVDSSFPHRGSVVRLMKLEGW